MPSPGITRFARVAKGVTDDVSTVPRVQPTIIGKATVTKIDLAQNICYVQLSGIAAAVPLRLTNGAQPKVGDTVKTELDHPVMYVTSVVDVPDPYITTT